MATLNGISVSTTTINGTTWYDIINGDADSETIYGLDGGDTINGFEGNDYLSGGNGSDLLNGGSGNDSLIGGLTGYDTLSGGEGNDIFVIERQSAYGSLEITDFTIGQDKLDLSATGISDIETLDFLSYGVANVGDSYRWRCPQHRMESREQGITRAIRALTKPNLTLDPFGVNRAWQFRCASRVKRAKTSKESGSLS